MAERGNDVSIVATVRADPISVAQMLGMSLQSGSGNYFDDTKMAPVGPTTFRITRRYVPQWAIITAVIGALCALAGLLLLLIRNTEILMIDIKPTPTGSQVTVTGKGTGEMVMAIQGVMARFDGYSPSHLGIPPTASSAGMDPVPMSEDRAYWWDGGTWRSAMESAPPNAEWSQDGTHWFDGRNWRPVTPQQRSQGPASPGPAATDRLPRE